MNTSTESPRHPGAPVVRTASVGFKAARDMSRRVSSLVRTTSFAGNRGSKMSVSNDETQTRLGGRRETMRVNFPGMRESDDPLPETDHKTIVLKVREPKLSLSRSDDPAKNLVCLPHDGFRMQLKQMYDFLKTWKAKDFDIGKPELLFFYSWWEGYKTSLFDFFTIEEKVLFTWIETKVSMPKGLHVRERMTEKLDIIVWGQEIDKLREKFDDTKKPRDYMSPFLDAVEDVVVKTLQYFNKKERVVPSRLREAIPEARWPKLEKRVVEEIFKSKRPDLLLVSYMNQAKDTDAWKKSSLTFVQRTKFGKWSSRYEDHLNSISV